MTIARVLMTADTVGGVWTYALELARQLGLHGIEVTLATMGPEPAAAQRAEARRVPGLDLRTSAFALEWMPNPWRDVARAGGWLLDLERETRPAVVHVNGYVHAALPWRAPVLVVAHSCVSSWWQAVRGTPLPHEWRTYREAVRTGLVAADRIVAPTRAMREAVATHYGAGGDAVVIPNTRAHRIEPRTAKEPFVFAAGRLWDEAKNLRVLDAAARRLPWPVRVAGDLGGPDGTVRALAHVECLGRLPAADVSTWMTRAAVYALPARYEPFGLSVLEAALAGCAMVLGDIASLRENWDGTAEFVAPDDVERLAAVLAGLATDEPRRSALAASARARAEAFAPARQSEAYRTLYQEMVAAGRGGARRQPGGRPPPVTRRTHAPAHLPTD